MFVCSRWGWKGCPIGSMKQGLIDIVFTSLVVFLFLSLSLSLSLPYWFHLGGRVGSWGEVWQSSLNLNYDITLSSGGWARFPRLWSYFCPLHVFVVCCWGGKVVPFRAWSKSSLTFISLLWMSFTISSCCNLGERVCGCLLLLGWKGCRLVYLFSVARVQGLVQAPFRRLVVPPLPSLLSLLLPGVSIYLFVGRKRVLFCQSRCQASSENHVFPFVRCVTHLLSLCSMQPSSSSIVTGMKGLSLDQWRCIYLSTCCWWGTMGS